MIGLLSLLLILKFIRLIVRVLEQDGRLFLKRPGMGLKVAAKFMDISMTKL
jgi:hypothetical protein